MFYSYDVKVTVTVNVQPDELVHSLLFKVDVEIFSLTPAYEHEITICVIDTTSFCE